ncbi:MAG: GAF domain-containing protein [Defluviitaleaceae bacterium]|nr:GAF domain-containing protein [Defluviitaleaceae bacterium]
MKNERIFIIGIAALTATVFSLVFLAIFTDSVYYAMAASSAFVALIIAMTLGYVRSSHQRSIKEMTHELIDISNNLEERDYSHYSADTKAFYCALSQVKETLTKREQTRKEILDIAHYVALNMDFDKTLRELMPRLAILTNSQCCAFYTVNNVSKLTLRHSTGFSKNIYSEFDLTIGEGFIGHLALQKDITVVYDVPDDTLYMVRTFLGKIKPRNIMVVPIFHQEQLNSVMVCASINTYTEEDIAAVEMIKYYLSVAVCNGINAEKNKRLTNELAFQNKLIQNQHEEMHNRLKDKELLVYHLVNMLSDEIAYILDVNYKVLCWNKSAVAIYGLTREEAADKHIEQIHANLGLASIEKVLANALTIGNVEHHIEVTLSNGANQSYKLQFTRLAENSPLGIVVKVMKFDE